MITPFSLETGGGDQENTTSLSPAIAVNISGAPNVTGYIYNTNKTMRIIIIMSPETNQ